MHRLTISVNKQLALSFDELIKRKGYRNRSEAFRHLLRKTLQQEPNLERTAGHCVGCLSYTYDHQQPQPQRRLADLKNRFTSLTISSTLATVNKSICMETLILHGAVHEVLAFADAIVSEVGIDSGHLNMVPIDTTTQATQSSRG